MTTNRKIAKISALLMLIAVIGNVFSMLKEMLVASTFGLSGQMDAFYAAWAIPGFISNLLLNVLSSVFIPLYITVQEKERDHVVSAVMNWTILAAILCILPIAVFPLFTIKVFFHGFTPETMPLAASLLRQLAATVFLSVLAGLLTGLLNARGKFALPAASTMAITFCTVGTVLWFSKQYGIYTLSYGLLTGLFIQTTLLWRELRRDGFSYAPSLNLSHPETKKSLSAMCIFFLSAITGQTGLFISQMLASWLPEGSVSAIGYANKLLLPPTVIFSGAIATAVLPFFSRQTAAGDMDGLAYSVARSLRMTAYLFIPFTLLNIVFAEPVIRMLFERGMFKPEASALVAETFIFFAIQLFFNAAGAILARVYFTFKEMRLFLVLSATMVPMNAILSIVFIKFFTPPVAGLALAASLTSMTGSMILYFNLKKLLPNLNQAYVMDGIGKATLAGAIATAAAFCALKLATIALPGKYLPPMLSAAAALLAFWEASHVLKIDEYLSMLKIAKDKLSRFTAWA